MVLGMREGYHGAHSVRHPVRHLHVKPTWGLPLRLTARYAFVLERMWPVDVEAFADVAAGVDGRVGPCQGFGMVVSTSRAHLRINRF